MISIFALVSEEDWRAIEETLYLMSIPGMTKSIKRGMKEPLKHAAREIDLHGDWPIRSYINRKQ